jgi:hypothetical protein
MGRFDCLKNLLLFEKKVGPKQVQFRHVALYMHMYIVYFCLKVMIHIIFFLPIKLNNIFIVDRIDATIRTSIPDP